MSFNDPIPARPLPALPRVLGGQGHEVFGALLMLEAGTEAPGDAPGQGWFARPPAMGTTAWVEFLLPGSALSFDLALALDGLPRGRGLVLGNDLVGLWLNGAHVALRPTFPRHGAPMLAPARADLALTLRLDLPETGQEARLRLCLGTAGLARTRLWLQPAASEDAAAGPLAEFGITHGDGLPLVPNQSRRLPGGQGLSLTAQGSLRLEPAAPEVPGLRRAG